MSAAGAGALSESQMREFFQRWEKACHAKDFAFLHSCFASEGVTFRSPAVHKPYTDMSEIMNLLSNVLQIINGFRYTATYYNASTRGMAWVFTGTVPDKKSGKSLTIEGVDFVELNEKCQIISLKVMFRPLGATLAFVKEMGRRLMGGDDSASAASLPLPAGLTSSADYIATSKL